MTSSTKTKAASATSASERVVSPRSSRLTTTTKQAKSSASSAGPATSTKATSATIPEPGIGLPSTCDGPHHWLVSAPRTYYSEGGMRGELMEDTQQICKNCGTMRLNSAVVLPEWS